MAIPTPSLTGMVRLRRIFGRFMILLAGVLVTLVLGSAAFMWLSPQFGARPDPSRLAAYGETGRYRDGKFTNQLPTDMSLSLGKTVPMMYRYFTTTVVDKVPTGPMPMRRLDSLVLAQRDTTIHRLTWFGHSTCLLETGGKKILFDPMFGDTPAPLPFLTGSRFNAEMPIQPDKLPRLDAVVISHDHFDHLDYGTIQKLKEKADLFLAPLGVGAHLLSWGVEQDRIRELDWGDSVSQGGFTFVCAPARHFSGRGLRDGSSTLWASWIVKTGGKRIYFSGDSGYGPHFQAIGTAHGPFDLVMIECGQYNADWSEIHLSPVDAVKAAEELGGKLMVPIHWGAFALSLHAWYEPIRAVTAEARARDVRIAAPELGEAVFFDRDSISDRQWWP